MSPRRALLSLLALVIGPVLLAAPTRIASDPLACIAVDRNPRITARIEGQVASAKIYFHAVGMNCDYFVQMTKSDTNPNLFTGILPLVAPGTDAINYQIRVDTGGGREVSIPPVTVAVRTGCSAPALSADELRGAAHIILGLIGSAPPIPCGMKCNGITNIFTASGHLEPNEKCRLLLAGNLKPWYETGSFIAAAGGSVLAAGIGFGANQSANQNNKPPSPFRPPPGTNPFGP